jgi:succinate dehydrogenase/fumarate reductase-like Fe-S protein
MCLDELLSIPLQDAYLCPECGLIVNCSNRCACGNELHLQSLASILNRRPLNETPIVEGWKETK